MTEQEIRSVLKKFMTEEFFAGGAEGVLTETTPLVESGLLDSLRISVLLTFIRDSLGLTVSLGRIDARTFADIRSIARMLAEVPLAETRDEAAR